MSVRLYAAGMLMMMKLTIVTAASDSHFQCVQNLLWTISRFEPSAREIVYGLGLSDANYAVLHDVPPFVLANWELRKFDFTKYPPHFDMAQCYGRMCFKPAILASVAHEVGGVVLWMDAGSQIREPIHEIKACIEKNGIYCPCVPGTVKENLFTSTASPIQPTPDMLAKPIRNTGLMAFDTTTPGVITLLDDWNAATMNPNCFEATNPPKLLLHPDALFAVLLEAAAAKNGWMLEGKRFRGLALRQDTLTLNETKFRVGVR